MDYYIFTTNPSEPDFVFDAVKTGSRSEPVTWTKYALESGANISDYGTLDPITYTLTGTITATPNDQELSIDRVQQAYAKLAALRAKMQPISVVGGWWVGEFVISSLTANESSDLGKMLEISIGLEEIKTTKAKLVDIDPSKLKDKIKKKALKKKTSSNTGKSAQAKTTKATNSLLERGRLLFKGALS